MSRACIDCGSQLQRQLPARRWPIRCPSCKSKNTSARLRSRATTKWSSAACVGCGTSLSQLPRRGPFPKLCPKCMAAKEVARSRERHRAGRDKIYSLCCLHCGNAFLSSRPRQKFCSAQCGHTASRSRVVINCTACGKQFERRAGRAGDGKFCSRACFHNTRHRPSIQCLQCGKPFPKRSLKNEWQGKNKFCSRECSMDHRWGKNRPRAERSGQARESWAKITRTTTLRRKCRHYNVPFDPVCTREAVCERDGWVCQNCGTKCHKGPWRINKRTRKASLRNAEHDHIVPLSWGVPGKGNTFDNSQCLCRRCNGRKSNKAGGQLRLVFVEC
jgi:hypothetical protein